MKSENDRHRRSPRTARDAGRPLTSSRPGVSAGLQTRFFRKNPAFWRGFDVQELVAACLLWPAVAKLRSLASISVPVALFLLLVLSPGVTVRAGTWPDEYQAGQFIFHADFPLATHRPMLNSMPALQTELVRLLGVVPSREPIHVFLFERKTTYQAYLRQYFPDAPPRKALFIKQRGPGMVFAHQSEDFETDVRHECTHALLNAALPMVPLWLDEGLAEYFEMAADQRAGGSPHFRYVKWGVRFGQVPKLEDIEQVSDLSEMNSSRYRHAWAWVHFMLHGPPQARDALQRYLADIQALTPPGQLSRRLRHQLPQLDRRFAEHFKHFDP
jgi:hypothetical protein